MRGIVVYRRNVLQGLANNCRGSVAEKEERIRFRGCKNGKREQNLSGDGEEEEEEGGESRV